MGRLQETQDELKELVVIERKKGNLKKKDEREITKSIENPDQLVKDVGQAQIDKEEGKAPSVKSQFLDAMTHFAPQIIGTLGGALFEGEAGAVEGFEAGTQIRGQLDKVQKVKFDQDLANQKLEEKKRATGVSEGFTEEKLDIMRDKAKAGPTQKTLQQTQGIVNKHTGEPLVFNPNTGKFQDSTGSVVSTKDIRSQRVVEEERRDKLANVVVKKFKIDKAKAKQLSDKQVETLKSFDTSLKSLDVIADFKTRVKTGPLDSKFLAAQAISGIGDTTDFVTLRAETENAKSEFMKAMSGAQVAEAEARRLANILPTVNDQDDVFVTKLQSFQKIVERHKQSLADSIQSGQPLKREVIDAMLKEAGLKKAPSDKEASIEAKENARSKIESMTPEQQRDRLEELKKKHRGVK